MAYHFDRRGSTIALTDISGQVTDSFQYTSYGLMLMRTGATDTPFLYCGKYGVMSDESGLYYMRARYYNPYIMRFINEDTFLGDISNSTSLNRYAYAEGNPIVYVDPTGHYAGVDDAIALIGGAASGLVVRYILDVVDNYGLDGLSWGMLKPSSGWQDYVGAAAGGAVTVEAALYTVPAAGILGAGLAGGAGGAVDSMVSQGLKKLTKGDEFKFSWSNVVAGAGEGALFNTMAMGAGSAIRSISTPNSCANVVDETLNALKQGSLKRFGRNAMENVRGILTMGGISGIAEIQSSAPQYVIKFIQSQGRADSRNYIPQNNNGCSIILNSKYEK